MSFQKDYLSNFLLINNAFGELSYLLGMLIKEPNVLIQFNQRLFILKVYVPPILNLLITALVIILEQLHLWMVMFMAMSI